MTILKHFTSAHYNILSLFFGAALLFSSCETKVDINADYDDIPVVYCLLDPNDFFHWVKVNKTFLTQGDINEAALIQDSLEFDKVEGTVKGLRNGEVVVEYTLQDSMIRDKSPGAFAHPNQKMYYFTEGNLDKSLTYRLELSIDDGRKEVVAETKIIDGLEGEAFSDQFFTRPSGIAFAAPNNIIEDISIRILPQLNQKRGDLEMIFYYTDFLVDGEVELKQLVFKVGGFVVVNPLAPRQVMLGLSGQRFFETVAVNIPSIDESPNVLYRKPGWALIRDELEFRLSAAAEDLHIYMEVKAPSNTSFQATPEYTNIEGGIGVFSSRVVYAINRNLNTDTKKELGNSLLLGITADKGFCFDETAVNISCP